LIASLWFWYYEMIKISTSIIPLTHRENKPKIENQQILLKGCCGEFLVP